MSGLHAWRAIAALGSHKGVTATLTATPPAASAAAAVAAAATTTTVVTQW